MQKPKQFKEVKQYKKTIRYRSLIFWAAIIIALFFLAAMFFIGVGDAEWAGLTVSNLTSVQNMEYGIPNGEKGVVVKYVEEQAYYSGVKEGDLLKAINGKPVRSVSEFLKVARGIKLSDGVLLDILRVGKPLYIVLKDKLGFHGAVKDFFSSGNSSLDSSSGSHSSSGSNLNANGHSAPGMTPVAMTLQAPTFTGNGGLPSPKEQGAAKKILVEGHWLGMEVIPLTPELAKEYLVPPDTAGILVDEVALEAAESGLLAGDMVEAVNGFKTPDILAFTEATRRVKNNKSAEMLVYRRGKIVKIDISAERTLGFSQNESAQPIPPGSISPHRTRSQPCTACHVIMISGGQLPTDAGDILPTPPPIPKNAVALHGYRGECKTCHVILN